MAYKVQNVKVLTSEELIRILHKSAILYSEYADTTLLFIFREKKTDTYDYYEVRFGKNNFMHLAGIKSNKLSANEFYEACVEGTITKEDCNPRRDAVTMYLKVASYLEKNEDRKKEYVEIVDKLEREIKTFLPVADRIIDIDNNYGIDNIEEIVNLIFQYDMTVEDVCYSMGLDEEKKNLAILLIARESYYQERYKLGDFYIKKISKIKNRSIIVDRLYKVVLRERNFYKNRDDSNHKKLVLYKEG